MGVSAYAMVVMADGSEKRAEDIAPGDSVLDATTGSPAEVRNNWQGPGVGMTTLTLAGGSTVDFTADTLIGTNAGTVEAGRLAAGALIATRNGFVQCVSVSPALGDYMVYDLQLAAGGSANPQIYANSVAVGVRSARS